ncbi:hypothetical protein FMK18_24520 [Klebsiella grimontii]|nr:hypothetical protein [Klebsiella grimontii]
MPSLPGTISPAPTRGWRNAPYPGYRSTDNCEHVARAGALRRPREQNAAWLIFPEAMLRICPGYPPAEGFDSVSRELPGA